MPSLFVLAFAVAASASIALVAWRAGSLTRSGSVAALVVGTVTLSTGPGWGAYLVTWFVVTTALSRLGRARKARHVHGIVAKGGARDGLQVLANGGVFAVGALITWALVGPPLTVVSVAAAAALAAAGADTMATEGGTWAAARAWSLRTWGWVPAGTSGAVSVPGTMAMVAGALLWSWAAVQYGVVPAGAWHAVAIGGVAGASVDTLLGATAQQRRACDHCGTETEQHRHECGYPTRQIGGASWLDNDLVNLLSSAIGSAVAAMLLR